MQKIFAIKPVDGQSSQDSQVKNCIPNQFQTWKCPGRNNDK